MGPILQRSDERIDGVYADHLRRVLKVMREHYPKVLAASRFFEEETGIHNEPGANNLSDALSHIGTLAENADEMSYEAQGIEVHEFEDHLRRGMMESYEQIYRRRMGLVARRWEEHAAVARPLIRERELRGVTSLDELDKLRRRCRKLLDEGREAKRGKDWNAWHDGTEAFAKACRTASELADALEDGIAAAKEYQRTNQGLRLGRRGIILGVVLFLLGPPAGYYFSQAMSNDPTRIPDVVGQREDRAAVALSNADLRVRFDDLRSPSIRCRVASTTPAAGAKVDRSTTVTLSLRCP